MCKVRHVRCGDCGFLARRPMRSEEHTYTGIVEVDPAERENPAIGLRARHPQLNTVIAWDYICFRGVYDIPKEVQGITVAEQGVSILAVFNQARVCPAWSAYQMGLDPKEHLMEKRLLLLEGSQRRMTIAGIIIAAILALGQIGAAILAATPDSFIGQYLKFPVHPAAQQSPPATTHGR